MVILGLTERTNAFESEFLAEENPEALWAFIGSMKQDILQSIDLHSTVVEQAKSVLPVTLTTVSVRSIFKTTLGSV